jgi:LPS-assembly protein
MGRRRWSVLRPFFVVLLLLLVLVAGISPAFPAKGSSKGATLAKPTSREPIQITADRLEYLQDTDTYEATGSVIIVQGPMKLTADKVTIQMLSGTAIATGRVHLSDVASDLGGERLELNFNTDAGVITNGTMFMKLSRTLVTGRLLQRFSEDHIRAKDGSFTNCDAKDGQTPAWRFTFKDVDLNMGESLYGKDVWFCVNDVPVVPLPALSYPIQTARKSGPLVPTYGWDNRFGNHYRQGYFWAVSPSQDVTITPDYLSRRGYGGDLEYRYVMDRRSRGQWLVTFIEDTTIHRGRALITGSHIQHIGQDLSVRAQANLLSDPKYYSDLSNSGVLRALPSQESNLNIIQRFTHGNLYALGQYLQPLQVGGGTTFQRLPEIGHNLVNMSPFGGPVLLGMESTAVYFAREQGFGLSRVDLMPSFSTDALNFGHVVGLTPQLRLREVYYTRGVATAQSVQRQTFWASLDATSRLTRRFGLDRGGSVMHTIEPDIIYEFVPPTDQSKIVQIDAVDDLTKKNLLTYSIRNRLLELGPQGGSINWLDLTLAQSYHVGSPQNQARLFPFPGNPLFIGAPQQLQPQMVGVNGRKFSDIWARAVIGNPVGVPPTSDALALTIDSFFSPYRGNFSQVNTDLRYQHQKEWYVEIGQRYTTDGNRVRRGDIWNPISFNEVFAPTQGVQFLTASAATRLPYGVTIGAKTYYNTKIGQRSETDVVGLYQNPCKCWSLGLYYIQFPDRVQYNFVFSLTGLGWTESFGTQVLKGILNPLVIEDRGLPWATPYGPYGKRPPPSEASSGTGKP